ncbi:MAG: ABC transporter permease [Acetatifactor sp.]|nr:ABC transporter permease [Acetatifactor sp.]
MKNQLSAWKYVKNNKRVVAVLVTALALSFMAMYAAYVLLITTTESFEAVTVEMPKKISYASLGNKAYGILRDDFESYEEFKAAYDAKQEDLLEKLRAYPGIDDALYTQVIRSTYQSVMGSYSFEVPLMEPEKIQGFLEHVDAKLLDGRMPKDAGEVLIDETIRKNGGYHIGDWFQKDWFGETFRIVGTIQSKGLLSVGVPNGYSNNGWYIVVYNDESTTDLTGILQSMGIQLGDEDEVLDAKEYYRAYRKDVGDVIDAVLVTLFVIVMTFLAILVLVTYVSFMRNRVNEYCLYASLGYGRGEIYGMMLKEMTILFGFGTALGLLISLGIAFVLHGLIIEPKGLIGHIVYEEQICRILGTYVFLMGVLQIPVLFSLQRIRTIDAIED